MGIPATSTDFRSLILQSNLIDAATLNRYFQDHAEIASLADPTQIASALVRDGLLTQYQAQQLIQGKWKGFFIGRYKVLGMLGAGGMGKVFLCEHAGMRRQVAIKVLPPKMAADPATVEGFYREAQALASLDHRNIIHAYDAANDGDLHYLVMEYVKGRTLEDIVSRDGPLSARHAINYLRQAALGLQHAYEAGLVHRDIKPSNFLVTEHGIVKILDLGLAQFFHERESGIAASSKPAEVMGTVDYMSPEQGLNAAAVDIRGDIYSLGATFYFCLAGRSPYEGGTTAQKILWHQIREPEALANRRSDLPAYLIAVVSRMMAKDPANRFQTPDELLLALPSQEAIEVPEVPQQAAIDTGLNLESDSPTLSVRKRPQPAPKWRPSVGFVAGLSVVLAIAAVAVYFVASQPKQVRQVDTPEPNIPDRPPSGQTTTPVASRKIWLSDLPEQDPVVGHGRFGKAGQTGYDNHKIVVKGEASPHGLSLHPATNNTATVRYELRSRYRNFAGTVAINDSANGQTKTPLTFVVKGDGKVLWESKPVRGREDAQSFSFNVESVSRLDLEVRCPGDNGGAHAVWLEPSLTMK
ncbi:MAG: protein kinase [Planctomycetes bacterium]|nr:protein kinase [Planctomycetota bacterium]